MEYLIFVDYLKQCPKPINLDRYEQDAQYRCVLFRQYSRQYRIFCENHQFLHQYEDIRFEVEQYEKRTADYHYRVGV